MAVQELVGETEAAAGAALTRLAQRLGAAEGHPYTARTADSNDVIRNGFLIRTDGPFRVIEFNGSAETNGAFKIYGGIGNGTLIAGAGNDWIFGGAGGDTLTGRGGNDIFYYDDVLQSIPAPNQSDKITDFASGDKIDLSGIDAVAGGGNDSFTYIGGSAFSHHAGELQVVNTGFNNWMVAADVDGDGNADFQLSMTVSDSHPLTSADFVL